VPEHAARLQRATRAVTRAIHGQGPSGPSERKSQGPSGPSERKSQGPSGPAERNGEEPGWSSSSAS
jgi:hypothetical protein